MNQRPDPEAAIAAARERSPLSRLALRTALLYAALGFTWIAFSDVALMTFVQDRPLLAKLGALKALVFIVVTALLLYWTLRHRLTAWEREAKARLDAEIEAHRQQALYESLFANMINGLAHCQMVFANDQPTDFVYLSVNKAFETLSGLHDVVGRRVTDIIPGIREADPGLFELYGRVARTGVPERCETYVSALKQWYSISVYCPAAGQFVAVFDVVTERKKIEEGLRVLSRAIEYCPVSIIITDPAGTIQYVNPRFTAVSGYTAPEVRGQNVRMLRSDQPTPAGTRGLWATITAGREWHGDFCNRRKNGEQYWERASISPLLDEQGRITHFVAVKEDITERRQLEEHLRRSQRMEAVGALASGIAHDLNNILTPVLMASGLLKDAIKGAQERTWLDLVEQSTQRASSIVKQLLAFGRGSGGERAPLQMRQVIKELLGITEETFPRNIALQFEVASNLPPVLGDATQLQQVLLNLCVNARDAMPDGGALSLRASHVFVDAELARVNPPAKPGPHVVLTVADAGHGMAPEIMERIFDPFFTTKEIGKGTGLGLPTVLGIVRSHGGFVTVQSAPAHGTTFCVYLPAAPADLPALPTVRAAEPPRAQNELILVVDDEPNIAESSRAVLERHGYRVLVATGAEAALAIFRRRAQEVSLTLTDVMMPGMNGVALLREMRQIYPPMKAIVTTGMPSSAIKTELAALGITELVPKPCSRHDLLETVRKALAA